MTYSEIAKKYNIPIYVLKKMRKEDLISQPMTEKDIEHIAFLSRIWGKNEYLRAQLAQKSRKQRRELIREEFEEYPSKLERYVLNRYLNMPPGRRLSIHQVANEVRFYFKVKIKNEKLYDMIRKIRHKAYNIRLKQKKQGLPTGEQFLSSGDFA